MVETRSMANKVSVRRNKTVLPYKSIVRTRAQKLRENRTNFIRWMHVLNEFYSKNKYEPGSKNKKLDDYELYLTNYLVTLRSAVNSGQISEQEIKNHLTWFELNPTIKKRSFHIKDAVIIAVLFGLIPSILLTIQFYANQCISDTYCMSRVITIRNDIGHDITLIGSIVEKQMQLAMHTIYNYANTLMN